MKLRLALLTLSTELLFGCVTVAEEPLPATPENYAAHSKFCQAATQKKERVHAGSISALRGHGTGEIYVDIPLSTSTSYVRCMWVAGYSMQRSELSDE